MTNHDRQAAEGIGGFIKPKDQKQTWPISQVFHSKEEDGEVKENEKGKPSENWRRKATGLKLGLPARIARLPKIYLGETLEQVVGLAQFK